MEGYVYIGRQLQAKAAERIDLLGTSTSTPNLRTRQILEPIYQNTSISPCRTSSAGHLTRSTTASVKIQRAQRAQRTHPRPPTHQIPPSKSHSIKLPRLLSLSLTSTRLFLVLRQVLSHILSNELLRLAYINKSMQRILPTRSKPVIGAGDIARKITPRQSSNQARRKKMILTGSLGHRVIIFLDA